MTIDVENAPGKFGQFTAYANYQAVNCKYLMTSSYSYPYYSIPLEFVQILENQYQVRFYLDGMLDEDYYGTGICEWKLQNVSVLFSAIGAKTDTRFSAGISDTDLDKKMIETNHRKEYYPIYEERPGSISNGLIKERALPEEYFTFYTTIEKI